MVKFWMVMFLLPVQSYDVVKLNVELPFPHEGLNEPMDSEIICQTIAGKLIILTVAEVFLFCVKNRYDTVYRE